MGGTYIHAIRIGSDRDKNSVLILHHIELSHSLGKYST